VQDILLNAAPVATGITYHPFGAPRGWTWSSGPATARPHDLDGRQTGYTMGPQDARTRGYDAASRITSLSDPQNPGLAHTFS